MGKYKDKSLVIIGVHSPEFEFVKGGFKLLKAQDLAYNCLLGNNKMNDVTS